VVRAVRLCSGRLRRRPPGHGRSRGAGRRALVPGSTAAVRAARR
jgi:hypothetical protein